jgi:hypothetical protein
MKRTHRSAALVGGLGLLAALALLLPAVSSANLLRTRVAGTGGLGVNVRSAPGSTATRIGGLREGAAIDITCQKIGPLARFGAAASPVWDRLSTGGWISDLFAKDTLYGLLDYRLPTCGQAPPPVVPASDQVFFANDIAHGVASGQGIELMTIGQGANSPAGVANLVDYSSKAGPFDDNDRISAVDVAPNVAVRLCRDVGANPGRIVSLSNDTKSYVTFFLTDRQYNFNDQASAIGVTRSQRYRQQHDMPQAWWDPANPCVPLN